MNQRSVD